MTGMRFVRAELTAQLFTLADQEHPHRVGPVRVVLLYDAHDPYAIELAFTTRSGGLVVWSIARDLLADGLAGRAGLGDVRIAAAGRLRVRVGLSSPSGRVVLFFTRVDLERALDATHTLVPAGTEESRVDWDRELARLGVA